ncbi:hypothetical protein [Sandarakinorhabdus sp. DWP1-3-1]|uniref:hypothetical protein n=1 Tax=Sandarakinorhabdus sp. DWP1-3-1 TaxID=2804627 RepID=UPI003CF4954E
MNLGSAKSIARTIVLSANQYINFQAFENGPVRKYVSTHDDKHRSQSRATAIAREAPNKPVSYYQELNPENLQQSRDLSQQKEVDMLRKALEENWKDNAAYHESFNVRDNCVNPGDFNLIVSMPDLFSGSTLKNGGSTACNRMVITMGKAGNNACIHTHFPISEASFNLTYNRPLAA